MHLGMLLILAAFVAIIYAAKQPKVKIIPAAHMQKVPDVVMYETNVKIVFKVRLPQYDRFKEKPLIFEKDQRTKVEDSIHELLKDYVNEVGLVENSTVILNRSKRQVFLGAAAVFGAGYLINSVFSELSTGLFGNENQITSIVNQLQKSVKAEDQRYVVLQRNVTEFATQTSKFQAQMLEKINKSTTTFRTSVERSLEELYRFLLVKIDHDYLLSSIDSCKTKHYPMHLVSVDELKTSLIQVAQIQAKVGKRLAIPVSNIYHYMKIPIYDCFFSNSYATVIVSVPLQRVGQRWALYKPFYHKFAFKGQTCQIYPSSPSFLAVSKTKYVLISGHMLVDCPVLDHNMCLIPSFSIDSSESLECNAGILQGKSAAQLSKVCMFQCIHNTKLSISQVSNNRVIVTNADSIKISCPDKSNEYQFEKIGSIDLTLKCSCNTTINNLTSLKPVYCVDSDHYADDMIYRSIPTLWSGLDYADMSHDPVFLNFSDSTFDQDWFKKIPVLNLTAETISIPEQISESSFKTGLILMWLVCLTCVMFFVSSCLVYIIVQLKK